MKHRRRCVLFLAAAAATLVAAFASLPGGEARAQAPRTLKIVVPVAPGGPTDTLARVLGEQIGRSHGLTVVVEDRPGGGSVIGTEAVARAAPDGSTVLVATPAFALSPYLRKLTYDPLTSFEPICHLVDDPSLIVVNAASPYRSLDDLFAAARARPGDLTFATVGPGTPAQLGVEMLLQSAKVAMTFVPYTGYAPSVTALLGGHVTAVLADYEAVIEQLKAGTLRALASASRRRSDQLPDIPTVAELGHPDAEADIWFGLVAPAGTPRAAVAELERWFAAALEDGDVRAKLTTQGLIPVGACGAEFAAFIRRQYETDGRLLRRSRMNSQ